MGAKCNHAYRQCSARVRSPLGASVQCEQSSALRTSGAGSFQAVTPLPPQAPEEESRPSTPRYGFAVLIPACYSSTPLPGRIPPEVFPPRYGFAVLIPACYSSTPLPGRIPPEVFRAGRTQPSASAPGCWRRQCRDSATLRRSGPGPGGSLPTHNVGLFRCSREPCVSLPRRSKARRPSRCQTPSGATLHFVPRPWLLGDSKPGCRPDGIKNGNDITRITDPP